MNENQCPVNNIPFNEETVIFGQRMLMDDRSDMDYIVKAVEKIHADTGKINK